MHSLKGASGFLGLDKINGLAHKAENILDELRQGTMKVNGTIMDLILSATDALRTIVDNLESSGAEGDVDTAPIIAQIELALVGGLDEAATVPVVDTVSEEVSASVPDPVPVKAPVVAAPAPAPVVTESEPALAAEDTGNVSMTRSEERRVGKEGRL